MKIRISGLNVDFKHSWYDSNTRAFVLATAILAVAPAMAHSQTTESNGVTIAPKDENTDSPASPKASDWKQRHAERMKRNQSLARRLEKVINMTERDKIVDELRAIASALPKESRHAEQIRAGAKEITTHTKDAGQPLTDDFRNRIQSLSNQLSFQPKMESKLPVGFPAPTPVGEIEVKAFPTYRMAKTASSGSGNNSFFTLFNHIQSNDISMTAPVQMTYGKSESGLKEIEMAFLYGDPSIGAIRRDSGVEVVDVAPRNAIVLGMRGRPSKQRIAKEVRSLRERAKVIAPGSETAEEPRVFGYNSPAIPADNQFYEILLELQPKSD